MLELLYCNAALVLVHAVTLISLIDVLDDAVETQVTVKFEFFKNQIVHKN